MHPLTSVPDPAALLPEVEVDPVPLPQKTGNGAGPSASGGAMGEGTTEALSYARRMSPKLMRRLVEIGLTSPNHHAARASCRDVLQVTGLLTETRVDVVLSFRAIFQQMSSDELDRFLTVKEFPSRLRDEALKLLEHAA